MWQRKGKPKYIRVCGDQCERESEREREQRERKRNRDVDYFGQLCLTLQSLQLIFVCLVCHDVLVLCSVLLTHQVILGPRPKPKYYNFRLSLIAYIRDKNQACRYNQNNVVAQLVFFCSSKKKKTFY